MNDEAIQLSDYKGKIVLLNFWATFCAPCRMEMPSLQALSEKHRDRGDQSIAVSLDEDRKDAMKKWITKMGLEFAITLEGQAVGDNYQVSALPVTFIIDKQGQFIGRILGEKQWNDEQTTQFIESLFIKD